jgi:hypothetical protein
MYQVPAPLEQLGLVQPGVLHRASYGIEYGFSIKLQRQSYGTPFLHATSRPLGDGIYWALY